MTMEYYYLITWDINYDAAVVSSDGSSRRFNTKEEAIAAGVKLIEEDQVGNPTEEEEGEDETLGALRVYVCRFSVPEIYEIPFEMLDVSRLALLRMGKTDPMFRIAAELKEEENNG